MHPLHGGQVRKADPAIHDPLPLVTARLSREVPDLERLQRSARLLVVYFCEADEVAKLGERHLQTRHGGPLERIIS